MSIRVKTQPVEPITVSGASSMSVPEVSADIFRGVFHHLVYEGQTLTREVHGARPAGTLGVPIYIQDTGGLNTFGLASGGGVYGDDAATVQSVFRPITTNYPIDDKTFTSASHGLLENTPVGVIPYPGGSLPGGIPTMNGGYAGSETHRLVNVTENTFELSNQGSCVPSDSGGDLLFTSNGHGLSAGNTVRYTNITSLGGVTEFTDYYVISDGLTSSTWKISEDPGGAAKAYTGHSYSPYYFRSDQGMQITSNGSGQSVVSTTGMASFFLIQSLSDGDGTVTPTTFQIEKFFGPVAGRPYNRLEFFVKYPPGFRQYASSTSLYANFNIGTYHTPLSWPTQEAYNYHFYYMLILRHDVANGDWMRVILNDTPSYQRDGTQKDPGGNPTPLITDSNFLDNLTRFYIKDIYNQEHPELYSDYEMMIDRVRIYYEDPPHAISLSFNEIDTSVWHGFAPSVSTDISFTISNGGQSSVSGYIKQAYSTAMNPQIFDSGMSVIGLSDVVVVPAMGEWNGYLRFTPAMGAAATYHSGSISFLPVDQAPNNDQTRTPSLTDPNVEVSNLARYVDWGPADAWLYSDSIAYRRAYRIAFDGVNDKITFTDGYSVTNGINLILKRQSTSDTLPTGFTEFATYEVMNAGTAECQLSSDGGVTPITFTDDWSTASGFFLAY